MNLSVGYSKMYCLGMLLVVSAFGTGWYFLAEKSPPWARYAVPIFAGLMALSCLRGLLSSRKVVVVEGEGLLDRRLGIGVIKWEDIRAFRHVPGEEQTENQKAGFSLFESWRPVQLWVESREDSTRVHLHRMKRLKPYQQFPNALALVIDFSGLDTPSEELAKCLRLRVPQADEVT